MGEIVIQMEKILPFRFSYDRKSLFRQESHSVSKNVHFEWFKWTHNSNFKTTKFPGQFHLVNIFDKIVITEEEIAENTDKELHDF